MNKLWCERVNYKHFNPKSHHINDTCGKYIHFIPYERLYSTLDQDELLQLISDAKKHKWQALDLTSCGLTYLPDELWELPDLKMLYLGNRLQSEKDMSSNKFFCFPQKSQSLINLQVLSLANNAIGFENNLPLDFPNLIHLDIFDCEFPQIPEPLLISSVQEIGFNCLEDTLSENFFQLKNLKRIYLTQSEIKELPESIAGLSNLQQLFIHDTLIEDLPCSMSELKYLSKLGIKDTPLAENIPPEILKQSGKEIVRYIFSQKSNAPKYYFNESKMIIVGQGHVGKSSLLNRLVRNTYLESESTEGIDITSWRFRKKGQDYKLNVWDFGGQEIYHSTHQFFLTKRSLYILVWDALAEEEYGRIDYWLKTIQSLANDSPIIVVVNKCDQGIGRFRRLDEDDYKERFPQIQEIVYVSCKDNIGIRHLRKLIKNLAVNLPLMKTSWLSSWMTVREELEKLSKEENFISYGRYLEICKTANIDVDEARSLIKYLHDLGIVLYYHDDCLLKNLVILSSEWGTDAVYKVLDEQEHRLKGRNGILHTDDLPVIWNDTTRYPPERYPHLLNLMKKFQLAFDVSDSKYLVAELLDNKSINLDRNFLHGETLSFRYEYDFIPAGIMTRFIVSINHYLEAINGLKQCWKKGAYLKYHTAYALVRLHENIADRYVEIKVSGESPRERQELLTIIRTTFEEINNQFNQIKITERIPCICSPECTFLFDYKKLLQAEKKGKQTIECHDTFENVDIKKLLDGVESKMENNYGNPIITNIFSPQINSPISASATADAESHNLTTISIEIRDLINGLQGDFNDLKSEVEKQSQEFDEQCEKVSAAFEKLDVCNTKEDIAKSGAMKKIERFLVECCDPESKTGKMLSGIKYANSIVKDLAIKYNKIAKWISLPQIPFIGDK